MGLIAAAIRRANPDVAREAISARWLIERGLQPSK